VRTDVEIGQGQQARAASLAILQKGLASQEFITHHAPSSRDFR
jgi:hypothetical protein